MTAKLPESTREKIRAYWAADTSLTYGEVATRFVCSVRQVRIAVEDLPREGKRQQLVEAGAYAAAVRDGRAPPGAMRVLRQIKLFREEHSFSPSIRELCALLDISSVYTVRCHFDTLKKYGLITWNANLARTVLITTKGDQALVEGPTVSP